MGTWTGSGHARQVTARALALCALLALLLFGLVACGGSASTGDSGGASSAGSSSGGGDGAAAASDSFIKAYPTAQEAMQAVVEDGVLLAAGTGGLALADVPDNWSFTFYSPGENKAYMVSVEHGTAGEPREFGEAAKGTKVTKSIDPASIEVGAAQAVVKAREFGSQSGTLPKNVMVGGSFALTPQSEEAGMSIGVWNVTFATGTDLADAQKYAVDMMTGEVAAAKD
jgi:hypothetical protein